jgi:DNA replication and repair protein RecF
VLLLRSLQVVNFKNHAAKKIDLDSKLNAFCGLNGTGKTNLLDAIYYLCLSKSYFTQVESQNIKEGENYFVLEGDFNKEEKQYHIFCGFQKGGKKVLKCNDIPYEKFNDHIGLLPVVISTPADSYIIAEGSDERRRLLDSTLSQTDHHYLESLIHYNKLMAQRNAQLKIFQKEYSLNKALLLAYDEQIAPLNASLFESRRKFVSAFTPYMAENYALIAAADEYVDIRYQTEFEAYHYLEAAERNYNRDMALGYSTSGIHRDDLEFIFKEHAAKKWASQGQQKTFILALRLAQLRYMKDQLGTIPILLLDDIFDKLDRLRSRRLVEILSGDLTGQVFLTHTGKNELSEAKIFELN